MSVIEIEGIAELLGCNKNNAWKVVGNKDIWKLTHCGYRKIGNKKKRYWDTSLAIAEAERINKMKKKRHWKMSLVNRSYVMVNTSVRKFPSNCEIRAYLIEKKGVAEYRAFA